MLLHKKRGMITGSSNVRRSLRIFIFFITSCFPFGCFALPASSGHYANENFLEDIKKRDWSVRKGQSLYGILSEWGNANGWEVVWDTEHNYIVNASGVFKNMDINSAVENLLKSMGNTYPQVFVRLYNGNKIILVKTQSGI